jgi:hypothetical protein
MKTMPAIIASATFGPRIFAANAAVTNKDLPAVTASNHP